MEGIFRFAWEDFREDGLPLCSLGRLSHELRGSRRLATFMAWMHVGGSVSIMDNGKLKA